MVGNIYGEREGKRRGRVMIFHCRKRRTVVCSPIMPYDPLFLSRSDLHNHIVNWDEVVTQNVTTLLGKDGILLPCEVHLSIYQVLKGRKRVATDVVGAAAVIFSYHAPSPPNDSYTLVPS